MNILLIGKTKLLDCINSSLQNIDEYAVYYDETQDFTDIEFDYIIYDNSTRYDHIHGMNSLQYLEYNMHKLKMLDNYKFNNIIFISEFNRSLSHIESDTSDFLQQEQYLYRKYDNKLSIIRPIYNNIYYGDTFTDFENVSINKQASHIDIEFDCKVLDIILADDIAELIKDILAYNIETVYNVVNPEPLPLIQFIRYVEKKTGQKWSVKEFNRLGIIQPASNETYPLDTTVKQIVDMILEQ